MLPVVAGGFRAVATTSSTKLAAATDSMASNLLEILFRGMVHLFFITCIFIRGRKHAARHRIG